MTPSFCHRYHFIWKYCGLIGIVRACFSPKTGNQTIWQSCVIICLTSFVPWIPATGPHWAPQFRMSLADGLDLLVTVVPIDQLYRNFVLRQNEYVEFPTFYDDVIDCAQACFMQHIIERNVYLYCQHYNFVI